MIIENSHLEIFRDYLEIPDLHVMTVENKLQTMKEFRQYLRQEIYEYFETAMENGAFPNLEHESQIEYDFKELLDLNKIPHPQWGGLSISHCPTLGVFVSSYQYQNLGVDVEQINRIEKNLIARVCSEEEMDLAPETHFLWTAKEAAFKSFYRLDQPKTLSEIKVFDWSKKSENIYHFRFESFNQKGETIIGEGLLYESSPLDLSITHI
ncbi:MAG: 4-phosphopantetheinyl transferase family protein [Bdellovibrionales bacterium]|nr:4-phosphopantetheinyl transferase family protein [Bdellovibrionales bacterium]